MSEVTPRDREWMAEALTLARRGQFGTAPNPRVGCVLVRDGHVLSSGWHAVVGGPHAEAAALQALPPDGDARGATAYVTLEPCSHHGRTPPCSEALIASGIMRCVVGMVDPNPKVAGSGIDRMRAAGIDVSILEAFPEGRWLNRRFLSAMERGRPWIVLKCAVSADGFIDPPRRKGEMGSLAITSPALRRLTHQWRAEEGAILVGAGTVGNDDPTLNVREAEGPNPLRIVLDPEGRTTADRQVYADGHSTLVVGGPQGLPESVVHLDAEGQFVLPFLMEDLMAREVRSVLVEGGADTLGRFLDAGLWDEIRLCHSTEQTEGGLPAPAWPTEEDAILRGEHPFGTDRVEYWVHPAAAAWIGTHFPPTLSVPLP
jgi:diaminohydroxyphosphoribosylaminopyrimidine deaminase/5-amino-6-(5-phosphoribosylamino)uracil reductase